VTELALAVVVLTATLQKVAIVRAAPAQSSSVSLPFTLSSLQFEAVQRSFWQTPLAQSEFSSQSWFAPHFPQLAPPQSMSVSSSFTLMSAQWRA
jgi:hypothetical protein